MERGRTPEGIRAVIERDRRINELLELQSVGVKGGPFAGQILSRAEPGVREGSKAGESSRKTTFFLACRSLVW